MKSGNVADIPFLALDNKHSPKAQSNLSAGFLAVNPNHSPLLDYVNAINTCIWCGMSKDHKTPRDCVRQMITILPSSEIINVIAFMRDRIAEVSTR